jgi:uncharacterized protein YndB with AHSA1/START domain
MTTRDGSTAVSPAPTRRDFLAGISLGVGGIAVHSTRALAAAAEQISHTAESIHQEVVLKAPPARVYAALTDSAQFQKVVLLSEAVKVGMVPVAKAAEISREPGGTFTVFGGHITGRSIELAPGARIVQAWRTADWAPGFYSIARFELAASGPDTRLLFDHTGFPNGQAEHLAAGWRGNYWEPLAKFLAATS